MVEHDKLQQTLMHLFMIGLVLCCVLPFLLMVMASFTDEQTLIRNGYSFFRKSLAWKHTAIFSEVQIRFSVDTL